MTLRLTLGVDPGKTGAIAILADGEAIGFLDMPVKPDAHGTIVDAAKLAAQLRGIAGQHRGAYVHAVVERVFGARGQGGASMFDFGQSAGVVRGVLGALGIPVTLAETKAWKGHFGLLKPKGSTLTAAQLKDQARLLAKERYPHLRAELGLKGKGGRADALLIAAWAEATEQVA